MISMNTRVLVYLFIAILAMLFTAEKQSFSDDLLSDAEILRMADEIKNKYENYVYTVNAYSSISRHKSIREKKGKVSLSQKKIGTAFPLDDQGHLITLHCVVKEAGNVRVISRSGEEIFADIVESVKSGRISILKIAQPYPESPPPTATWNSIHPGNKVFLLCVCPKNILSATSGTISEVRNSDGSITVSVYGNPEITAGTPVFDTNEYLVGIIGFKIKTEEPLPNKSSEIKTSYIVIPMEYASAIARSVINKPETRKGWLGVFISEKDKAVNGVNIQYVVQDSPAAKCGIKSSDCITEFNGIPVSSPRKMIEASSSTKAGDTVSIKIFRDGEVLLLNATLF